MTSRDRVLIALEHREPDRVPIDLAGSVVTSIAATTYEALRKYLGLPEKKVRIMDVGEQIAWVDEDVLEVFGADVIPLFADPPQKYRPVFTDEGEEGFSFKDEFGATLRMPKGGFYYDWREFPLKNPSIAALEKMDWPDPADPGRFKGLRQRALGLRSGSDRAIFGMAPVGHDLFNQFFRVRGMEEALADLVENQDFADAFLTRMMHTIIKSQELFLDEVGDLIDVHFTADDISGQDGPLISPALYRKLVKPKWERIISVIKSRTKAKIFYHGCGAMTEFIPDLIEIGVDIFNPVQVSAAGMDTAELKKKYGKNLSFWGGGCDTQHVLPGGNLLQVKEEVKRRIRDLAPGGGFIFNPVHNIQPNVPPDNIAAMFQTAREFGRYPVVP